MKSTLSLIVNTCEYFLNTYRPPRTIEEILLFSSSIPEKWNEKGIMKEKPFLIAFQNFVLIFFTNAQCGKMQNLLSPKNIS